MKAPDFWQDGGALSAALAPFGLLTGAITRRRVSRPGWQAPVPVICAGNAGVGGSGKTPVVLDLAARLVARGIGVHCLTRGYGGSMRGVVRVDPARHVADEVGDEALLLAASAPSWVGADRAATARAAVAAGAQCLIMDDGLQNPTLAKTASLLVIDGFAGFGSGRMLPAGPMREPVRQAALRCRAAVMIGPDRLGSAGALPPGMPVLQARLEPGPEMRALAGRTVLAFAGIGRPRKFGATLEEAGILVRGLRTFADHHLYSQADLADLRRDAGDALLVTTWKDYVRLAPADRAGITPLAAALRWANEGALEVMLGSMLEM